VRLGVRGRAQQAAGFIADGTITGYRCGRAIRVRLDDLEAAFRKIPSARW
jgi:hypothetical protein